MYEVWIGTNAAAIARDELIYLGRVDWKTLEVLLSLMRSGSCSLLIQSENPDSI